MIVCTKADRTQIKQNYEIQPSIFCETHKLSPPHAFTAAKDARKELFTKLATMAVFP